MHSVPPSPIALHLMQSRNIVSHLSPQVVLDLHGGEFGSQGRNGLVRQGAYSGVWEDGEFG